MGLGKDFTKFLVDTGTKHVFKDVPTFLGDIEEAQGVAVSFEVWNSLVLDDCVCAMIKESRDPRKKLGELTGKWGFINGTCLAVDYEFPTETIAEENCYYVVKES